MAENEKTDIKVIKTEEHQKPDGILTAKNQKGVSLITIISKEMRFCKIM